MNAETGDDGNAGTLSQPLLTLNEALQRAYDALNASPTYYTSAKVKVHWTETPIAPFGRGGEEYFGWKESPSDPDRDPFPIRMIPFVDIVGVKSTSGERPKITIWEEDPSGVFLGNFTKWSDFDKPRRALVHAASNSKLLRIDLDGELYLRKNTDRIKAVWAEDVVAFEVRDCVARRLYDGIYFFANHDGTVQASVVDCTISEFFPFLGASSVVEEQGHAGLWLEGAPGPGAPSSLVVDVSGCTFTGSHDGLEVIGKDTTTAVLDLTDCDFIENENGLEVVGTGDLQFLATDCRFIRNHNIDGGTPLLLNEIPHSTAGIAFRGMRVMGAVRNCYFENNGYGILWLPHTTPALPELDLGTHATTDPGGNVFELDFGAFPAGEELLRVCLYNSDVSGDSEIVAVGNTWYHDNGNGHHGASSTGELTGFFQGDPNDGLNLTHEDGPFPPGPMVGKCCDPSTSSDWLRNFSLKPNATGFRSVTRALRVLVALLVAFFGVVSSTPAQLVFDYEKFGSPAPNAGGKFGYNLLVLDIDHDGFDDLVATQEGCIVDGLFGAGCVWILRGPRFADAIRIQSHQPAFLAGLGQNGVSMGDVNGDHVLDLLVGAPIFDTPTVEMGGRAHLFYGPDFRTEVIFDDPRPETRQNTVGGFTYHGFGAAVLLADLDGDGRDEVVIGAPQASDLVGGELVTNVGEVFIAYASDLTKLVRLRNPDPKPTALFGFHLASIPPLEGPGDDLLVAAPLYDSLPNPLKEGILYRFLAPDLAPVQPIVSPSPNLSFFGEVQHVEDIDGDGLLDLFVAAPWSTSQGTLTLLKGPDFSELLHEFKSPDAPLDFGEAAAVADVNWDGASDVVIGDPGLPSAIKEAVRIFYGPDFTSMQSLGLEFTVEVTAFGLEVAAGDFDGDRIPEIAVTSWGGFEFGSIRIANQRTLHSETTAFSLSTGATVDLALDLGPMAAGESYLGLLSVTPSGEGLVLGKGCYLPLAPDAVTFAALALLDTPVLQGFHGVLDEQGRASLALQWPAGLGQELAGSTLRLAVLTFDADGRPSVGSNALALELQP